MKIYYYNDKKEKAGSHEIRLNEDLTKSFIDVGGFYTLNISLEIYEDSREEAIKVLSNKRKVLASDLRKLADEMETMDLIISVSHEKH
jgi:hypothetical protein